MSLTNIATLWRRYVPVDESAQAFAILYTKALTPDMTSILASIPLRAPLPHRSALHLWADLVWFDWNADRLLVYHTRQTPPPVTALLHEIDMMVTVVATCLGLEPLPDEIEQRIGK